MAADGGNGGGGGDIGGGGGGGGMRAFLASLAGRVPDLGADPLEHVLARLDELGARRPGAVVECGVFSGRSVAKIAAAYADRAVHGFDSFEGLPEAWERGDDRSFVKGRFDMGGRLPAVPANVELVPGWFDRTLPPFAEALAREGREVVFLHVDCDLYSSTKCVLGALAPVLADGALVVFDELFNYDGFERHEARALHELLDGGGWRAEWIGKNGPLVLQGARDAGAGWDQPAALRLWRVRRCHRHLRCAADHAD